MLGLTIGFIDKFKFWFCILVIPLELVKIDSQGRVVIPKEIRERKGLEGVLEVVETEEGVIIRPLRAKSWEPLFRRRIRVNWGRTLAVSLEGLSIDDLMLG